MKLFHWPTAASMGAKARPTRMEAAIIAPGEIFGLLGPNGSGKTTSINCILQLLAYDKGTIELFGEPMTPARYDLKRRIGAEGNH